VNRRRIPWLLSVPLMVGGTEVAHWLAFRLVYPDAWQRSQALQQTGHGYFSFLPIAGGTGVALLLSALLLHGKDVSAGHGRQVREVRLSQFAVLPPLAFALQEHLERLVHNGTMLGVVLEPTFMLGLLLQLPFALVAYLLARFLLRAAGYVGNVVSRRNAPRPRPIHPQKRSWLPLDLSPLRVAVLAGGHAERGPPL
jgi:hypothetical protein